MGVPNPAPSEPMNQTEAHDLARQISEKLGVYKAGQVRNPIRRG